MECPECRGEGRILLFVSSRECGTCKGSGTRPETPEKPQEAKTTDPPGATLQSAYDNGNTIDTGHGGPVTITGGTGASSGGDIVISGGSSAASGLGGSITLIAGNVTGTSSWYDDISTKPAAFSLASGGGPTVEILTGSERPADLEAPLGSMYMRDDGAGAGSLWVKTSEGPDGWSELSSGAGGSHVTTDEVTAAVDSVLNAERNNCEGEMVKLVAQYATLYDNLRLAVRAEEISRAEMEDRVSRFPILEFIPAVAPVSLSIVADMMAIIEQQGIEVIAFASSARDFADIRKFADGPGVKWEGKQCSYFGVPFFQNYLIPRGYMAAVSADHRLVLCTVTR